MIEEDRYIQLKMHILNVIQVKICAFYEMERVFEKNNLNSVNKRFIKSTITTDGSV